MMRAEHTANQSGVTGFNHMSLEFERTRHLVAGLECFGHQPKNRHPFKGLKTCRLVYQAFDLLLDQCVSLLACRSLSEGSNT